MIRCTQCGTLNRDSSRFCNDCGTPLQPTKVRCANCGALNLVGNVFCDGCNTRLVAARGVVPPDVAPRAEEPAAGLQSISLPTRTAKSATAIPDGAPVAAELPDWLLDLADEAPVETAPAVPKLPPAAPLASSTDSDLPDWLSKLTSDTENFPDLDATESETADMPAWLSSMRGETAPAPVPEWMSETPDSSTSPTDDALPDWLSGMDGAEVTADAGAMPTTDTATAPSDFATTSDVNASAMPSWMLDAPDDASTEDAAPPDWLSGIRDAAITEPALQAPAASAEEQPDWLAEVLAEPATTSEPDAAVPDWLSGMPDETEITPATKEAEPDWLAGLLTEGDDLADENVSSDTVSDNDDMRPDWLGDAQSEVSPSGALSDDWFSDVTDPPVEESDVYAVAPAAADSWENLLASVDEPDTALPLTPEIAVAPVTDAEEGGSEPEAPVLPDWLQVLADPEAPQVPSRSATLPDWLMAHADTATVVATTGPAPLPDWILAHADEPSPRATVPPDASEPATGDSDWLGELLDGVPPTTTAENNSALYVDEGEQAVAAAMAEVPADLEAPASLPDWLQESAESSLDIESATSVAVSEEHVLPDWLHDVSGELPAVDNLGIAPESAGDELPDWLSGMDSGLANEAEPAVISWLPEAESVERPPTNISQSELDAEDVPSWLREVEADVAADTGNFGAMESPDTDARTLPAEAALTSVAEEVAAADAPPDWLSSIDTDATEAAPAPADVPDWLLGMATADERHPSEAASSPVPAQAAAASEAPAVTAAGQVPDWLSGIGSEHEPVQAPADLEVPAAASSAKAPEAPTEVPDWLSELSRSDASDIPMDEAFAVDNDLQRAALPSWLQELRPPGGASGTGPLPPLPPELAGFVKGDTPPPVETGGLARADIPDWVRQLRPQVAADGTVVTSKFTGPAESEGPLSGLVGVIMPAAVADIPATFEPKPLPQVPDAIVQQAQLWQQLLEQPYAQARSVAQQQHARPGIGAAVIRILVLVLLLAAGGLGVLMEGRLAQAPPASVRPGVDQLRSAMDALQSGDTVIVAVEYGFAEAVEMQPLAETLLGHLVARDVNVIAVSTLPEGVGLAYDLLAAQSVTNTLPEVESPYRAGSYNGVADLLNRQDELGADFLLVVAGRTDRLRWWVEQNAISKSPLPIGLGLNASTGTFVTPYLESKGIDGWMVGFADMLMYRQSLYGEKFDLLGQLDLGRIFNALMLSHWVAIALLIFGLLYAWISGNKRTR